MITNKKLRTRRKLTLLLSVVTAFAAGLIMMQFMFAPSIVTTVYAGSTLTPTPVPPPPTNTPAPTAIPATAVPATPVPTSPPSTGGGSQPSPTATPIPPVPQEIPSLGGGPVWQPLILSSLILMVALAIAGFQVHKLMEAPVGSKED